MDKIKDLFRAYRKTALGVIFFVVLLAISKATGVDVTHLAGKFTQETEAAIVEGETRIQLSGVVTNPAP